MHIVPKSLVNICSMHLGSKLTNNDIFNVRATFRSSDEHMNLPYIEVLPSALLEFVIAGQSPPHAMAGKIRKARNMKVSDRIAPNLASNQQRSFFSQLTVMKTKKKMSAVLIEEM